MLICIVSWHTFDSAEARSAKLLICGFLIVAWCDTLHAMTYNGMPSFLAPSTSSRTIFFWLMGRSFEVITMALVAIKWAPPIPMSRRFWLGSGLFAAAIIVWTGSYHLDVFPETFVTGQGVTTFKAAYEYVLCLLNIVVAVLFWKQAKSTSEPRYYLLTISSFVMGIGEIMFTNFVETTGFRVIIGHGFKIVSYALLYRATFVTSMRAPYHDALEAERRSRESEERFLTLTEMSSDFYWETDVEHRFTPLNSTSDPNVSSTWRTQVGQRRWELPSLSPDEAGWRAHRTVVDAHKSFRNFEISRLGDDGSAHYLSLSGDPIFDAAGNFTGYRGVGTDITERMRMEEQVRQLAFYDTLTQLPNRRLLSDHLLQAMAASKRSACYGALMFLDLDNFKPLNDRHGHAVGDMLLIEAANRLKGCVREVDTVARFGGDEFVLILSEMDADKAESTSKAEIVAEKIRASLSEPYLLAIKHEGKAEITVDHRCTVSIGVTLFINQETSPDDIIMQADTAMYQAKESGRNLIRFYG